MAAPNIGAARALVYGGVTIRERGEDMLSLTDMWRAAGKPANLRPRDWLDGEKTKKRIAFLAEKGTWENLPGEQYQTLNEGGEWNTWAHWALGIEYAEDLSVEMWFWAKTAIREKMECHGVPVQATATLTASDLQEFAKTVGDAAGEAAARTCVSLMRQEINTALSPIDQRLSVLERVMPRYRRPTSATKAALLRDACALGCRCPMCGINAVTGPDGARAVGAEIDHWFSNQHAGPDACWPLCKSCHDGLTAGRISRTDADRSFHAFQDKRKRIPGAQPGLF